MSLYTCIVAVSLDSINYSIVIILDYTYVIGRSVFIPVDWDEDGTANHVGIVEYYHDGIVYTVEGNRDDTCVEGHYSLNSKKILGYGIINE